jgi:hypothetical protein
MSSIPVPRLKRPRARKVASVEPESEGTIQRAVFDHIRRRKAADVVAFHVPNGGKRGGRSGRLLKLMGMTAGIPDVVGVKSSQFWALELKTLSGSTSKEQDEIIPRLAAAGALVGVAYGLNEALRWLEANKIIMGEAI